MTDPVPDEEAKALGRRLKAAREAAHLPQDAVAPVLGASRSAVSDIERGTRQVGALELGRLAGLYEVPLETLLYGEQAPGVEPWSKGAVYASGTWRRLPKLAENILAAHTDAYERDGAEAIGVGEGTSNDGAPYLGVWLRADEHMFRDLPLFEVNLSAGALHLHVYAQGYGDVLYLLRELSPTVKNLHAAQLAAQLAAAGRCAEQAGAILKAAEL